MELYSPFLQLSWYRCLQSSYTLCFCWKYLVEIDFLIDNDKAMWDLKSSHGSFINHSSKNRFLHCLLKISTTFFNQLWIRLLRLHIHHYYLMEISLHVIGFTFEVTIESIKLDPSCYRNLESNDFWIVNDLFNWFAPPIEIFKCFDSLEFQYHME